MSAHRGCFHCSDRAPTTLESTLVDQGSHTARSALGASSVALCPECRAEHAPNGRYAPVELPARYRE